MLEVLKMELNFRGFEPKITASAPFMTRDRPNVIRIMYTPVTPRFW